MNNKKCEVAEVTSNEKKEDVKQKEDKADSVLKKKKQTDMVIAIFSVVCALLIWIYAYSISLTEVKFQSAPVVVMHESTLEAQGYRVQYKTNLEVNYTLHGTVFAVSQIEDKGIEVKVDLSMVNLNEIEETKVVQLPLIFELPADITCSEKSQEYIEVTITKNPTN